MYEVALPTEGVDRNGGAAGLSRASHVALPTEGVDRNLPRRPWRRGAAVALPTEGVDRNYTLQLDTHTGKVSPSPRRAWIEILRRSLLFAAAKVALPTEGVDRNSPVSSSRKLLLVALPTEGVDRNQ